jgi:bacterioferritin-associated ferredoxin
MTASVPGVFVAGELTGIAGAVVAELEGRLAGDAAASYLGRSDTVRTVSDHVKTMAKLRQAMRFADLLGQIYTLQPGWMTWPNDDTVVCRCEDVTWGTVRRAVESGAMKVQAVRGLTRCGMGYCQGRTCGPALNSLVAALTGAHPGQVGDLDSRPVVMPVALRDVAKAEGPIDPKTLSETSIPEVAPLRTDR